VNTDLPSGVTFACPSGVAALTVPPRDTAALAAALRRLFAEPDLRRQLGRSGRAHVEAAFPADRMVAQTMDIYRQLHGGARAVA
jgi:rhamnosyl/mannosyltransferase